jgi:hypothetical protein
VKKIYLQPIFITVAIVFVAILVLLVPMRLRPEQQILPSVTPAPISNNKFYKDSDFSFEYPSDWPDVTATEKEIISEGHLVINRGLKPVTYQNFIKTIPSKWTTAPTTLGNLKGVMYTSEDNAGRFLINLILAPNENSTNIFSLIYLSNSIPLDAAREFNNFISTFKFTQSQAKVTGWKIINAGYSTADNCLALVIDQPVKTSKTLDEYINTYTKPWMSENYPLYNVQFANKKYPTKTLKAMNAEEISNTFMMVNGYVYKMTATLISNKGPPTCKMDYTIEISSLISQLNF